MYFDKSLDRWVATVYRGLYQKPKAIYGAAHGAGGKTAVLAKRKQYEQQLARGEVVEAPRGRPSEAKGSTIVNWGTTLGDWGTFWLDHLVQPEVDGGRLSPKTLENYRWLWRQVSTRQIARVKPAALKRSHIVVWWDELKADGVSDAARHKAKVVLGTALAAAVDRAEYTGVQANAAKAFTPSKADRYVPAQRTEPDHDVTRAVLDAVADDRLALILDLGWRLGMRRGEFAALQNGDIDLERGVIIVQRHAQRITGQGVVVQPGVKSGAPDSFRLMAIDPVIWGPLLQAHRVKLLEFYLRHQKTWTGPEPSAAEAWLFPSVKGTVQDPQELYRWFKDAAGTVGHRELFPHKMRHDFVSVNLNAGVSLWDASHLAGHSNTATTQRYAHMIQARLRTINKADAWLASGECAQEATG